MGQINCQCQINNIVEEQEGSASKIRRKQTLNANKINTIAMPIRYINTNQAKLHREEAFRGNQQQHANKFYTIMQFKGKFVSFQIKLLEGNTTIVGTSKECHQCLNFLTANNIFKFSLDYKNRGISLRDFGLGLGCWVLKKKIVQKANNSEVLINISATFVMINFSQHSKVKYSKSTITQSQTGQMDKDTRELQIMFDADTGVILQRKENNQLSIKSKNKEGMWVSLSSERRIKEKDQLRLGLQIYKVERISNYLESSTLLENHMAKQA